MTTTPNYRKIAREAIPILANCYDCPKIWAGPSSRAEAMAHREAEGHAVFVECKPKDET